MILVKRNMTLQTVKKFLDKYRTYIIALIIIVPVFWVLTHPAIVTQFFETFQDVTDPTTTTDSITTTTEPPTTTPADTKCSISQIDTINTIKIPAI